MITGKDLINEYYESEKLYSTGDDELDDLLERAFCEGYEYAQKEFAYKPPMSQENVRKNLKKINQEFGTNYTKLNQVAKDAYQGLKESGIRGEKLMKATREGNKAIHKGPKDAARLSPYSIKTLKLFK